MEGRYYTFYQATFQPNHTHAETFDIDDILNSYLKPVQSQGKQAENVANFETAQTILYQTESRKPKDDINKGEPPPKSEGMLEQEWHQQYDRQSPFDAEIALQTHHNRQEIQQRKNYQPETLNLSTYFHQEISNYLSQLHQCRFFSAEEYELIQKYSNQPRTFQTNYKLFRKQKIRNKCLQYVQSSHFIHKILKSNRMKFPRKIRIIKYIGRLCECIKQGERQQEEQDEAIDAIKKWKKQ